MLPTREPRGPPSEDWVMPSYDIQRLPRGRGLRRGTRSSIRHRGSLGEVHQAEVAIDVYGRPTFTRGQSLREVVFPRRRSRSPRRRRRTEFVGPSRVARSPRRQEENLAEVLQGLQIGCGSEEKNNNATASRGRSRRSTPSGINSRPLVPGVSLSRWAPRPQKSCGQKLEVYKKPPKTTTVRKCSAAPGPIFIGPVLLKR